MNKLVKKYHQLTFERKRFGKKWSELKKKYKKGIISPDEYELAINKLQQDVYCHFSLDEMARELQIKFSIFATNFGGDYDLENPKTYNEKIQWLKVHGDTPIKTQLSDKYEVKFWISKKIGDKYIIPTLGVWDKAEDIDFDSLPNEFVLKANHSCGMNIIVRDKKTINKKKIIKTFNEWMDITYGYSWFETQYINIPKKIIAEQYIEQMDGGLFDYKIHCFNGIPKFFQVIGERKEHTGKQAFYDVNWKKLSFSTGDYPIFDRELERPNTLEEMIRVAKILSEGFTYVRVDLYEINNEVKFGEMTFTPYAGLYSWNPPITNVMLGEWIKLPIE